MRRGLCFCLLATLVLSAVSARAQRFGRGGAFHPPTFGRAPASLPTHQFFGARAIFPHPNRFLFPPQRGFFPRPFFPGYLFPFPYARPLSFPVPILAPSPLDLPFGYGCPYPAAYGTPYAYAPCCSLGGYGALPSDSPSSIEQGHNPPAERETPEPPSSSARAREGSEPGKSSEEVADPRTILVTVDGQEQPSLRGNSLTVDSGRHLVRISARPPKNDSPKP